jgi:NitT/TauT family transport system permease protein
MSAVMTDTDATDRTRMPKTAKRGKSTAGGRTELRGLRLAAVRLAVLVAFVALWHWVGSAGIIDPTAVSSPSAVGSWLRGAVGDEGLWTNVYATLYATVIAWSLASVIGTVIGISLALAPNVERVVEPFLSALNALPRVALAPLFIVAFGLSINSKIALAFSIVIFLAINAAQAGVASVDIDLMRLSRALGASRREQFFKILLPVAIPSIFGGLRMGWIYGLLGTLTAEMIGSVDGIGQELQEAAGMFEIEKIYGILIMLAVIATVINTAMAAVERRLSRWQR